MSGGSFNYLCHKYGVEVFEHMQDLKDMAAELHSLADEGTPGARQAAKRTDALLALADIVEVQVADLSDVWHAVEWWRSCDWSREQVVEALESWRPKR